MLAVPLVWAAASDVPEDVLPVSVDVALAALGSVAVLVVPEPVVPVAPPEAAGAAELPVSVVGAVVSAGAEAADVGAAEVVDGAEPPPEPPPEPEAGVDDPPEPPPEVPVGDWLAVDEGPVSGSEPDGAG